MQCLQAAAVLQYNLGVLTLTALSRVSARGRDSAQSRLHNSQTTLHYRREGVGKPWRSA